MFLYEVKRKCKDGSTKIFFVNACYRASAINKWKKVMHESLPPERFKQLDSVDGRYESMIFQIDNGNDEETKNF